MSSAFELCSLWTTRLWFLNCVYQCSYISCQCTLPPNNSVTEWVDINIPSLPAGWKGETGLQPHHTEGRTWSHAERRWAILLSVPRLRLMETKHSYLGFLTYVTGTKPLPKTNVEQDVWRHMTPQGHNVVRLLGWCDSEIPRTLSP